MRHLVARVTLLPVLAVGSLSCGGEPVAATPTAGRVAFSARAPRGGAVLYDLERAVTASRRVVRRAGDGAELPAVVVGSQIDLPGPWLVITLAGESRADVGRYPIGPESGLWAPASAARPASAALWTSCTSVCGSYAAIGAPSDELVLARGPGGSVAGTFRFTAVGSGVLDASRADTIVVQGRFDAPCDGSIC